MTHKSKFFKKHNKKKSYFINFSYFTNRIPKNMMKGHNRYLKHSHLLFSVWMKRILWRSYTSLKHDSIRVVTFESYPHLDS